MRIPDYIEVQGGPISMVFTDDGCAFFSERVTGNIWRTCGEDKYKLIKHLPVVSATGHHEMGLLGISLGPGFNDNDYMYAYYTDGQDESTAINKVVRFHVSNPDDVETILDGIPAARIHNGGIIAFGPDDKLYIGTGVDNPVMEKSQDKSYLGGKILRINQDGSIPDDNPYEKSPVYSYGHRNIFGMAFHPDNKKLYICDVGPDRDDEINISRSAGNFGWPRVVGYSDDPQFINPIKTYTPTITPTQCFIFNNELFFSSYNEGTVHKLTLSDDFETVVSDVIVYRGRPFGFIGVFKSPSGEFFVAETNNIVKIKLDIPEK